VSTYKSVSSGFSRLSICDDDGLLDVSVDLEVFPQRLVGRVIGQATHEELGPHGVLLTGVVAVVVVVRAAGGHVGHNCVLENKNKQHLNKSFQYDFQIIIFQI